MLTRIANEDSRLSFWLRVREFAVPASMIETATARRRVGDWAGACAAAGVDIDLDLRTVARTYGRAFASCSGPICVTWRPICCDGTCQGSLPTDCCGRG